MTGVAAGLMQGQTGVFAEWMQGRHLYVLGYSASVFGNLVSMLIATLGLSGHSNGYRAIVAMARLAGPDHRTGTGPDRTDL